MGERRSFNINYRILWHSPCGKSFHFTPIYTIQLFWPQDWHIRKLFPSIWLSISNFPARQFSHPPNQLIFFLTHSCYWQYWGKRSERRFWHQVEDGIRTKGTRRQRDNIMKINVIMSPIFLADFPLAPMMTRRKFHWVVFSRRWGACLPLGVN